MPLFQSEFDASLLWAFNHFDKDDPKDQALRRKLIQSVEKFQEFKSEIEGEEKEKLLYKEIFFELFDHLDEEKLLDFSLCKKAYKLLDQYLIRIGEREGVVRRKKTPAKSKLKCNFSLCALLTTDPGHMKCEECNLNAEFVEKDWEEKQKDRNRRIALRVPGVLTDFQRTE